MLNQELDNILQQAAQAPRFTSTDADWQHMQELIKASEEKRKRRPFAIWWITLLLLLVGTGLWWAVNGLNKVSTSEKITQNANKNTAAQKDTYANITQIKNNEVPVIAKTESAINTSNIERNKGTQLNIESNKIMQKVNNKIINKQLQTRKTQPIKPNELRTANNKAKDVSGKQVESKKSDIEPIVADVILQATSVTLSKSKEHTQLPIHKQSKQSESVVIANRETKPENDNITENTNYNLANNKVNKNTKTINQSIKNKKVDNQNVLLNNNEALKSVNTAGNNETINTATVINTQLHNTATIATSTIKSTYKPTPPIAKVNKRNITQSITYIPVADTFTTPIEKQAALPITSPPADMFDYGFRRGIKWALLAGVNYSAGFTGNLDSVVPTMPQMHKSASISPVASVQAQYQFTPKWQLNFGLGYSYNSALNTMVIKANKKYYFGRDTSQLYATYKSYHYLMIPLNIQYSITPWLYSHLGGGATYMMDVNTAMVDASNNYTAWGYGIGFNRTDAFASFGLGIKFTSHLMLDMQVQQGFRDITNNIYFKQNIADKQRRAMLQLVYQF
jgi:hypothetical protein